MSEQHYFKKALSDFTYDVASGGAVRHLTDVGYTVKQIMENLSYPTPYKRVQRTVWEHLLNTGVILLEEPGTGTLQETVTYVKEYNKYGKASFRRITKQQEKPENLLFKEERFVESKENKLDDFLLKKCAENEEKSSYVSCPFGLCSKTSPISEYLDILLEEGQREYLSGLPWERRLCYHRLDRRMREITVRLYSGGGYHGCCYFLNSAEKIVF